MSRSSLLLALLVVLGFASLGSAIYLGFKGTGTPALASAASTPVVNKAVSRQPVSTPTRPAPLTATAAKPAPKRITIQDGNASQTLQSEAGTVGDLLVEAGIVLKANDGITPALEAPLVDKMEVQIARAVPLTIQVDGQALAIFSGARTTVDVLAGAGIALGELDYVTPPLDSPVHTGAVIRVIRVREETIVTDQEVPYQTLYQPSEELDLDTKAVLSSGAPGILRSSTRIRYEDGVEVNRVDEGQWMEREPVNEVIGYGTRITTNIIDTPEGPREYWRVVRMRATAYTAASSGKSPDHPSYGITASGLPAGTGIVAVDPHVIPFRSEVYVPGYGVGFAGDTGGGVKGRWIDLGYDEDELQAWNGYVDVYYLTPIPAEINYLLPEVLP